MKTNRVARVILGILVLIMFGVYSYLRASTSPHSDDIGAAATQVPAIAPVETAAPEETVAPTPTPEPTLDPDSPAGRAADLGLPAPPEIDLNSWEMLYVNSSHTLDSEYAPPELSYISDSQCPVDSRIAQPLTDFMNATKEQGLPIYLSSGYRSYADQNANLQRKLNEGYSYEVAITIVAEPGTSEHQTGLCCDITDYYRALKDPDEIEPTETYQWMSQHCHEYGFIVRFPKDKQDITGIIYEPWHYRYVGVELATYMMENGLCLEEVMALYGVE